MATYFSLVAGIRKLLTAVVASAGAADQDKLVATNASGKVDQSVLPIGSTATDVASGDHLHDDRYLKLTGGTLTGNISITKDGQAGFDISSYGDSYSTMLFRRYRGSQAAPGAVLSGDLLGGWVGQGYDSGSVLRNGAILYIQAAGDFSSSSAPGRLIFQTTPVGSVAPQSRLRIEPDGTVLINTGTSDGLSKTYVAGDIGVSPGSTYRVNGVQVVSARRTGWGAPTGTATRAAFATTTVTTAQLAERVKALIDDLTAHGLIGP